MFLKVKEELEDEELRMQSHVRHGEDNDAPAPL